MRPVIEIRPLFYQFGRIRHGARCPGPAGPPLGRPTEGETPDAGMTNRFGDNTARRSETTMAVGGFSPFRARPRRARATSAVTDTSKLIKKAAGFQ